MAGGPFIILAIQHEQRAFAQMELVGQDTAATLTPANVSGGMRMRSLTE